MQQRPDSVLVVCNTLEALLAQSQYKRISKSVGRIDIREVDVTDIFLQLFFHEVLNYRFSLLLPSTRDKQQGYTYYIYTMLHDW